MFQCIGLILSLIHILQDFKLVAGLTNGYKDGDFNLDITLHKPHPGGTVEVKVMDKGNVIYQHKKEITSATDTLFITFTSTVPPG